MSLTRGLQWVFITQQANLNQSVLCVLSLAQTHIVPNRWIQVNCKKKKRRRECVCACVRVCSQIPHLTVFGLLAPWNKLQDFWLHQCMNSTNNSPVYSLLVSGCHVPCSFFYTMKYLQQCTSEYVGNVWQLSEKLSKVRVRTHLNRVAHTRISSETSHIL